MKKYDKYKDSGIEWVGEIPEHWEVKRVASLGKFSKGGGVSKSDLTVDGLPVILYGDIYTKYDTFVKNVHNKISVETAEKARQIEKNAILFTGSGETIEDIGKCVVYLNDEKAYAGGDVIILEQQENNSLFLSYVLNTPGVKYEKAKYGKGEIVVHIYSSQLREIKIPIPPPPEQTAIATYLDRKTAEIDQLIEAKKRLIELYHEEKTAIINQAVTKGINPNATMKDSGIEWLGEVPEHWEVKRLKTMARVQTGGTPKIQGAQKDYFSEGTINWFTPGDFNEDGKLKGSNRKVNKSAMLDNEVEVFPEKSVYLVCIGATLGKVGICNEIGTSNQQINIIVFDKEKTIPEFGYYYILGNKEMILNEADYTTLPIFNQSKTKNLLIALPHYNEQQSIVHHIETECSRIDTKIERTQRLIELLAEYRTALISEVVTGKVKVV